MYRIKIVASLLLALSAIGFSQAKVPQASVGVGESRDSLCTFSPHTLIIYYAGEKGKHRLLRAVKKYKAEVLYQYRNFNAVAIRIPSDKRINAAITFFRGVKGVLSVERDRILYIDGGVQSTVNFQ